MTEIDMIKLDEQFCSNKLNCNAAALVYKSPIFQLFVEALGCYSYIS